MHFFPAVLPKPIMRHIGLALRVGLIIWLLCDLAPTPFRVQIDTTAFTVETEHPVVCVHTRLTDEYEEWKIQRTLQMVREMGAATIVEFFPWPYVESARGTYDWKHPDRIMRHAQNQGLTVIARLGLVPGWARPPVQEKVTTLTYLQEDYFADFAAYVGAFVAQYHDQLGGVIIWNEPNLSNEWGDRPVDPVAYTELLRLSYAAAKDADPNVVVFGGALAPTTEAVDSSFGMNEFDFLAQMYEAGAAAYFDVLAAHTYGFTSPPEADPTPDDMNFRRIELLRDVMQRFGDDDKPVTITESGWSDHPLWVKAVRPGQRIAYTLAAFDMVEGWTWADHLCLWIFRQPDDHHRRRDAYYALVTSDFYARPIYDAIQAYARGWENAYTP